MIINRSSSKSKHIDIKFLVVKERVHSGQVFLEYIRTNSMIANLLKGLTPKVFHEHNAHMGVILLDNMLVYWEFVFIIVFWTHYMFTDIYA